MCVKISVLFLFFIIQISCGEISEKPFIAKENNLASNSSTPEKQLTPSRFEPTEGEKLIIYWSTLVEVWADDEHGKVLNTQKGDLSYRLEAVSPQGIEQIENNQDISQSLITNFKKANQNPGKLLDDYPLKYPIFGYSGSRDMARFYEEAKRKHPETKAVVCFSNIGIDDSYTKTLVYAEYYRPDKGLVKFYLQMKMELLQEKINGDSFSGVESYKMIQVN
jgi:hypothetical protein